MLKDPELELFEENESQSSDGDYSRKDKSLRLLCSRFMLEYSKSTEIDIDEAALRLGVVRRRMYDIINVFEGIEVVQRRSRGQYTWFGFDKLPDVIRRQRLMGPLDFSLCEENDALVSASKDEESSEMSKTVAPENSKTVAKANLTKAQKSLGVFAALSQKLVHLFLFADKGIVYLESAALQLKTKMRRLYDIANILSSLHLIEKTYEVERIRKPAFKWIYNEAEHLRSSCLVESNIIRRDLEVITQRKRGAESHVKAPVDKAAKNEGVKKRKILSRSEQDSCDRSRSDKAPGSEGSPLDQLASVAHEIFVSMHEKPTIATKQSQDAGSTGTDDVSGASLIESYLTTRIASLQSLLSQISRRSCDGDKQASSLRQLDETITETVPALASKSPLPDGLPIIDVPLLCAQPLFLNSLKMQPIDLVPNGSRNATARSARGSSSIDGCIVAVP